MLFLICQSGFTQHEISIDAILDVNKNSLKITQSIRYKNTTGQTLDTLHFLDWANSFSSNTTPLGLRFNEDYRRDFHYAKNAERGATHVKSIVAESGENLNWTRPPGAPDILKIIPEKPLISGESLTLKLKYTVQIPSSKFTKYGYTKDGAFNLEYWYIAPAVYVDHWESYSNRDLQDIFLSPSNYSINLTLPVEYSVTSILEQRIVEKDSQLQKLHLWGKNQKEVKLYLDKINNFYTIEVDSIKVRSDVRVGKLDDLVLRSKVDSILNFLEYRLGKYPLNTLLISNIESNKNPLYGLNQLPNFLRPFPNDFQYEIQMLKSITDAYLENTLALNPRNEKWVSDGILVYLMMEYMNTNYPDMKLGGNLANFFGLRWFHGADLYFNEQYYLGYKNMARNLIDQSLNTQRDSLLKFNYNIANPYKSGLGLKYLEGYLEDTTVQKSIRQFYDDYVLQPCTSEDFRTVLESNSKKDITWFFTDFVGENDKIDFKIMRVKEDGDSLQITLKNKGKNLMPVSIHGLKGDSIISKYWVDGFNVKKTVSIPNKGEERLVVDYEKQIPEVKRNNNYRNLNGILNKPVQFRFIKDIEDPSRSQVFFMPVLEFNNIYDGVTLGGKFYNKTVLRRPFIYKITPTYGFKSKTLIGSLGFGGTYQFKDSGLYSLSASFNMNKSSYADKLFYRSVTPNVRLNFRNKDLRSNEHQYISLRSVNISRDKSPDIPLETPNYSILNARYTYSNSNFENIFRFYVDGELANNFSKVSTTVKYRKLFVNNRQIDLRLFAGTFLKNNTQADNGFFDFGLDRPTDYLFNYGYLGRSESEGLVSQQYLTAEGGFKSILGTRFANQWITTINAEASIWNWVFAYSDAGYIKNKGSSPQFVWDSGIKLSLVTDYFELYFPVASTNGFEMGQNNYGEKIRFKVTLSPKTLLGLFTRRWY
ncbi:gluzincin family metallopeptidase [Zobellia barbeyronii]|uniref:metalloprotease n=1 Tax=Zobellia barbeyronii TaxID=2748009 RepID=UPI001BDFC519|nr:metalloprotease [Zobellia barbeyronii]